MKNKINNVEEKLKKFPSHQMSRSTQNRLHQNVMDALNEQEVHQKGRGMLMSKLKIGMATAAAVAIFGVLGISVYNNGLFSTGEKDPIENHLPTDQEDNQSPQDNEQTILAFTEEMAIQVVQSSKNAFQSIETDENGKITHYQSRSEIEELFSKGMSADLASIMVEKYIAEKDNELFFKGIDAPLWLDEARDFELVEITDEHYTIIQEHNKDSIDHVEMTYHAVWQELKWKLSEVEVKNLETPDSLEQKATEILYALHERNMDLLSSYVHSEKGVLLSPYFSVSDYNVNFNKNEIQNLLENETEYLWGYGEANTEIRLTPSAYLEKHLQVERFFNSDEVFVDRQNQEVDPSHYLKGVFPNSKIVEFYHAGTEKYSGLDWRSLNLVFEQDENGLWKLVAIVNNLFTP